CGLHGDIGTAMRISHFRVENYRSLRDVEISISKFACLIGENSAGKSSAVQALHTFLQGPKLAPTDYYDRSRPVRIHVAFREVSDSDLSRLEDEHRKRIEKHVFEGRMTLIREYPHDGKMQVKIVTRVPREERFTKAAMEEVISVAAGDHLKEAVTYRYPEYPIPENGRITKVGFRGWFDEYVSNLPKEEMKEGEIPLPTGIASSATPFLPDVIYIPAVKELSDELKTSESATFGKLLSILFGQIEPQLRQVAKLFSELHTALNVTVDDQGVLKDERMPEVQAVENAIERNLKQSFPGASVAISVPPPTLRSLLSGATIEIDDGVSGHFSTKGDGLKRSVTFAILRAYVELRSEKADQTDARPCLLLFEEPEVFLHPRAQLQLFDALRIFSLYNDVLVTTHSSQFYSASATGTFVKMVKDHSMSPPAGRALSIDLTDMDARDQFQIITQENNDAAFFSDAVLLVEGDSDQILIPHIARTLNSDWDFNKRGVAVAKVGGKGSVERYRRFFEAFGVSVFTLTDLDSLLKSFNKLGASDEAADLRQTLMDTLHQSAEADFAADAKIKSEKLRALQNSSDIKSIWESVTKRAEDHQKGLCEWEVLAKEIELFFSHANSQKRLDELAAADPPPLKAAKQALIDKLRSEGIFVLQRGAIESYYPKSLKGEKIARAQLFCNTYTTAEDLRALESFAGDHQSEFDLIFRRIFS
ncbi:ATP-dependent endonuclease, partial [Streptomyces sp. PSKA30]|uniref:ATP-dependent nuclease n=1 Tax=Streptomyces sp. PSKA30 TaxID=2874597 RepID=UPI001CD12E8E